MAAIRVSSFIVAEYMFNPDKTGILVPLIMVLFETLVTVNVK